MRIVFMGTPDFASTCLDRLISDGHDVIAAFSQPDKPKNRGHKLVMPKVKELALSRGIPVFQPEKIRGGEVLKKLKVLSPELIAVVAYGQLLPREILDAPKYGCVNVHASLLPKLRGAAPIQWAIINGDKTTGVSTMFMQEQMDAGDIILSRETKIGENETAGELFERLAEIGAEALSDTVRLIENGGAERTKQDDSLATYAPMIDKKIAALDFGKEPSELCKLIRGLNPSPMAFTRYDGKILKVTSAREIKGHNGKRGELLDSKRLIIGCKDGAIELLTVRPEGKKPMSGEDFVRGKRFSGGEMFTVD